MSALASADSIQTFRSLTLERLSSIESSWQAVISEPDTRSGIEIEREVHDLRHDARRIGFHDVDVLCHKMEDLLRFARAWSYVVPESVDLLVATIIGIIRLLLHKHIEQPTAGLDLAEFSRQVDDTLREAYLLPVPGDRPDERAPKPPTVKKHTQAIGSFTEATLGRLAAAANEIYLHHLHVHGPARMALRNDWLRLVSEIRRMRSVPLEVILATHATAATELGERLSKKIDFEMDIGDLWVGPSMRAVVGMAVTHAVTNAVDHGIEPPDQRRAAGKEETGKVRVSGSMRGHQIEVVIKDDGRGVNLDAVRKRAMETGLLRPEHARRVPDTSVLEMLMHPSFSTRSSATITSGRGFGLDILRTALSRNGGRIHLDSKMGQGTRVILQFPQEHSELTVHCFQAPGSDIRLAVSTRWSASVTPRTDGAIDPLQALGLTARELLRTRQERIAALRLCKGQVEVSLLASGRVINTVAERICATDEVYSGFEVILLKDGEALLLHPEQL